MIDLNSGYGFAANLGGLILCGIIAGILLVALMIAVSEALYIWRQRKQAKAFEARYRELNRERIAKKLERRREDRDGTNQSK